MSRGVFVAVALFAAGCSASPGDPSTATRVESAAEPPPAAEPPAILVEPFGPPALPPPSEPLRVLVGGDLIPHRPSLAEPSALLTALAPLRPLFGTADAVIANYEAATGAVGRDAFRLAYGAPPAWLAAVSDAGVRAVTVANNHACDLGASGVGRTLDAAAAAGLLALGGDLRDPWAPRAVVEREGKRVCAVAWTMLMNAEGACARTPRLAIAKDDAAGRRRIASAIERARLECDATIAIIHGGLEYVPQTTGVLRIARQAAESGADAIVIHHPHVASPVVVHPTKDGRSVPIFASVGNLVSNQGESWKPPMFPVLREDRRLVCVNGWTRLGVVADLAFDFARAPRLEWGFYLVWTENEHAENRARVPRIATRLVDPERDEALLARLADDARGPVALFDDPCWKGRPVDADHDRTSSSRCETTLVRTPRPGGVRVDQPVALRRKPPRASARPELTRPGRRTITRGP